MASGTAEDEYVFLRGNYKTPGETAPRHPPAVVGGDTASATANGADRLRLARQIVGPSDPLAARVIVNRLWQHHFGAGLVRTPDDFGRMGESPTHPELLDYLACELIRNGWSLKHMHRLLVLTSTYRMASHGDSRADMLDPQNKWLHRMPIQRLEAEAIRDAILLLSGKLDRRVGGPPVAPYLTPFMEGRGRPATSGPLDGAGRRSIYLGVRRNFLAPLFLAFDYPTPFTAIGRRTISNVPAQALTLMNDPYVIQQANAWAKRLLDASEVSENERIAAAYEAAFARLPSAEESDAALAFLRSQEKQYRGDRQHAWADLCHVLLNVKEFIFVQ
jgi:hypothetical protein